MSDYFIDTHAHLYLPEFEADRDKVIERAVDRGVKKILLPNIDRSSIDPMNILADRFPGVCYAMMGLHPTSVKADFADELQIMEYELKKRPYCAIGEIGIDLYWDKQHIKEQSLAFTRQLDMALQYELPVVIHARESFAEILEILEDYRDRSLTGIFHAFTGTPDIARQVTSMGFLLGIGGILTYKSSVLPDMIREIDLKYLVLETDSPYLTPVPFRGKRNESSYIPYIAEALGQIRSITQDEVARITTENANHVFQLNRYVRS
jgi:TatD DNase family protein